MLAANVKEPIGIEVPQTEETFSNGANGSKQKLKRNVRYYMQSVYAQKRYI